MKLTSTLALFTLASPLLAHAQTTAPSTPKPKTATTTSTTKPAVHHAATTPIHHAATACTDPILSPKIPALPASVPAGCSKPLYSLTYIDTVIGTGDLAVQHKWYTVHYTGYLLDGTKFDSSVDRNEPITFPYGAHQVIPGWDTGFEGMHVGGKRRLYIPYQLAYGETGRPPVIPPKSELVFDVELVAMSDKPPAPKTPPAPPTPPPAEPAKPATDPSKPATDPSNQTTNPAPAPADATHPTDPTKPTVAPHN